ncbi:MAG: protein-export chaperone SecB, partial [Alphaproteobacteria bacterium]|nr:protein-export chaperone SecB [Alphaproteobacteria bacterium]
VTRDGGFPPLLLEPVDFAALYEARMKQGEKTPKAASN